MQGPERAADKCANDPSRSPIGQTKKRQHTFEIFFGNDHAGIADVETGSAVVVQIEVAGPAIGKIENVVDDRQQMRA